ncbi:IS110 family transposase [Cardiobacterium sp. AH-315-I02]|nr:IS110 family transposase [Cardiobacterium sp. AH-315-I02]
MNNRTLIAIDLAKNIFQVCRVSKAGKIQSNKAMSRQQLHTYLANSNPAVVAFEACGSAHYWGRFAQSCGHSVRMLPAKLVKAFRQGHKTDKTDAQAIALAAQHPDIQSCQLKTIDQQTIQSLETSRGFISKQCTALANNIRALVYEYGLTIPKGKSSLFKRIPCILEDAENGFPLCLRATLNTLCEQLKSHEDCLKQINKEKAQMSNSMEPCQRLIALEGVGPVVSSLLYASIGDGKMFKNGRAAATYVGVTPKQHSSGGKTVIVGITKHGGDKQLRAALYQGALSVISHLPDVPTTEKQRWLIALVQRAGIKRACIALANKTVRTAWALLSSGDEYRQQPLNI